MGDIGLIAKDDSCLLPDYLIPDKYLLNTYLLNPFLGKDSIRHSTDLPVTTHLGGTGIGAYRIRPPDVTVGDE